MRHIESLKYAQQLEVKIIKHTKDFGRTVPRGELKWIPLGKLDATEARFESTKINMELLGHHKTIKQLVPFSKHIPRKEIWEASGNYHSEYDY